MLHVAINCIVVQLFWWFETLCSLVGLFKPGGLDSKGSFLYYSTKGQQLILITLQMLSSNQSNPIQFWSGLILINGGGQIYPTITAISPTPFPSCSIHGILFLQTNTLALLLYLHLPRLLWSSSLPLALHFKLHCFSQNMPIIPPQHMPVPSLYSVYDYFHVNNFILSHLV